MNEAVEIFRQEAAEHLLEMETALLDMDERPGDHALIAPLFRAMHTIKGASGMVGFDHLSRFTHHLETFLDAVRSDRLVLAKDGVDLLLHARDHIEQLLVEPTPSDSLVHISESLTRQVQRLLAAEVAHEPVEQSTPAQKCRQFNIVIRPSADAFREGFDLLPVLRELDALGTASVTTEFEEQALSATFDPESCHLSVRVMLETHANMDQIEEAFFFVLDEWDVDIQPVSDLSDAVGSDMAHVRNGSAPIVHEDQKTAEAVPEASIRVTQQKLDQLMNQVGELVILQARLNQLAIDTGDERTAVLAEEFERLASGLRDNAFEIRMLPIGSIFGRFRRMVRDIAPELGKEVVLETDGAETELDKVMLDRLADPLIHLLRNSLDHGIEQPEQRIQAGKERCARLTLSASQHQGQVLICVSDDGAGLDTDRIQARAVERGLIEAHESLDEQAIHQLVFEPGFSTAEAVSDLSGRGVGMDVVKRSVEALQGRVTIESTRGKGTCVRIRLPMTLAIIEGLMVAVADDHYVIPLSAVEECIESTGTEPCDDQGVRLLRHRDELVPSLSLRDCFDIAGEHPDIQQTVIVRVDDARYGVTVDEVIGHHQTVIKNLGRLYQSVPGMMGATIMGNGRIAMILDLPELVAELRA
ncbi:chemotaxis protein CheA [Marinobacterium iners]|uniref:chemotaxis protein CheA n=1 Tax=Marinobacterium iners TaxID=48076 RepID=UPI001A902FA1|nr:chemotaxis protein CheA [Marinobacterium iners]QSR34613.1 chemotaxis protein CheA [Marinobacterium iners]